MGLGKICGASSVVLGAIVTAINTYHGGEPLPIVAFATVIGLLEYALLK
jgi:hypothetical protein